MPNIKDIAKECGVSVATVSRVLNNLPRSASLEVQQRVRDTASRLNYHPSAVARGLSRKRMDTIGILRTYDSSYPPEMFTDRYFGNIADGAICFGSSLGLRIQIALRGNDEALSDISVYADGQCDGWILVAIVNAMPFYHALAEHGVPFVLIGEYREEPEISVVDIDNKAAGYVLTMHLLDLGHRRIGFLCGDDDHRSAEDRLAGYRMALSEYGISFNESIVLPGIYSSDSGYANSKQLMLAATGKRPTALLCSDDEIALGVLDAMHDLSLRVPEDISVVGINDVPNAANFSPPLTTLRQPFRYMGECAVDLLVKQIEGKAAPGTKIRLPGELVLRKSTGPIAKL
jgi:DNA-binding LacI/PurR family transcriptional regulator